MTRSSLCTGGQAGRKCHGKHRRSRPVQIKQPLTHSERCFRSLEGSGALQTKLGVEQTKLGEEQTKLGMEQARARLEQTKLGVEQGCARLEHTKPCQEQARACEEHIKRKEGSGDRASGNGKA